MPDGARNGIAGHRSEWLDVDWREHLRAAAIDGRRLNYAEWRPAAEARPPLIMIHGLGGCWQNWLESIPSLGRDRRVVAPDLPGFGASELPVSMITIPFYAHVIVELCRDLGLDEVDIAGSSMGGMIGAELALACPERLRRLVLVAPAGVSSAASPLNSVLHYALVMRLGAPLLGARKAELASRPRLKALALRIAIHRGSRVSGPMAYELMAGAGRPGLGPAHRALRAHDYRDRLGGLTTPVLVLWGNRDLIVPVRDAGEYERLIPGARKVILEDCGHLPMVELPERFNALVHDFLAEPAPPGDAERA